MKNNAAKLSGLKVAHIMSSNVIALGVEDPVSFVIKVFDRANISGAPVVNETGEYVGVISKTDLFEQSLLEYLNERGHLDDLPVRQIMNPCAPITVTEDLSVEKAAELMLENRIHRVFVRDIHGRIVGVVSSYDILKVVAGDKQLNIIPAPDSDEESQADPRILSIRDQLQKSKKARQSH